MKALRIGQAVEVDTWWGGWRPGVVTGHWETEHRSGPVVRIEDSRHPWSDIVEGRFDGAHVRLP